MKPPTINIFYLEPSQKQKSTLCQRVSQWVSKWPIKVYRQTNKQTDRQIRIHISRDIKLKGDSRLFINAYGKQQVFNIIKLAGFANRFKT